MCSIFKFKKLDARLLLQYFLKSLTIGFTSSMQTIKFSYLKIKFFVPKLISHLYSM